MMNHKMHQWLLINLVSANGKKLYHRLGKSYDKCQPFPDTYLAFFAQEAGGRVEFVNCSKERGISFKDIKKILQRFTLPSSSCINQTAEVDELVQRFLAVQLLRKSHLPFAVFGYFYNENGQGQYSLWYPRSLTAGSVLREFQQVAKSAKMLP